MRIKHVEVYRFSIPMAPFEIATGTMDYAQNTFIRVHTNTGIYGVGECSAFPMIVGETQDTCLVLAKNFAQIWKGKDPLDLDSRLGELDMYVAGNRTIKSAFDMALYDLAAKHADLPLYRFLGGKRRDIVTDITLGIGSPEEMAEKAANLRADGAEILKIKVGKTPDSDLERIRSIRDAVGTDMRIRIDANQGWSFDQAVEVLTGLFEHDIEFCEQPMRSHNDYLLPVLRSKVKVHLMADESVYTHHDAERLCRDGACDYINIKFSKSGGIREALRIQENAAAQGIPCMIGGMLESRLALAAKTHFAYAADNVRFYDLDTCMVGHLEDPVIGGVHYNGYRVSVSEDVGIGADVDEAFLRECEQWVV